MKNKSYKVLALSFASLVASSAAFLGVSQSAVAGAPNLDICYRGRNLSVPITAVPQYVAAGAIVGRCTISPSL